MSVSDAQLLLARVHQLLRSGMWDAAESAAHELLKIAPQLPDAWACWGAIQLQTGRMPEAEQAFRSAVALNSNDADSWHHLSISLHQQGSSDEARSAAEKAIALDGAQSAFWLHLGNVLFSQERFAEAAQAFQQSTTIDAANPIAWNFLGSAHHVQKNWAAAEEAYRTSLALAPLQLDTRQKLGDVFERRQSYCEAEQLAQQILADYPRAADAWSLLGRAQLMLGRQDDAVSVLRRAVELDPTPPRHSRLLQAMQYADDASAAAILIEHRKWNQAHAPSFTQQLPPAFSRGERLASPLKLGFVSADLGVNPTGYMVLPAWKHLDKNRCSITCYFDLRGEDELTPQFRAAADRWRVVFGQSDEALAQQIQADGIDILVDLMGHAGNRLPVFARQPAPVSVTWFGYVGTTGLSAMDFLLADRFHVRSGEERHYAETVLRMPHSYACYAAPDYAPEVGPLPARSAGHVTFGCFNNPSKITPCTLDLWSEVLKRVPTARLLLKYGGLHDRPTQDLFRSRFAERGIAPERIMLEGWSPHHDLLAAYNRVDLALDTQPYSGGVTTCEALWMGAPVVTYPGQTFASRHATSHLTNAGYGQFIARDGANYVELAVLWANQLDELSFLRSEMRHKLRQSPLCDAQTFAHDWLALLEQAFRDRANVSANHS